MVLATKLLSFPNTCYFAQSCGFIVVLNVMYRHTSLFVVVPAVKNRLLLVCGSIVIK